MMGTRPSYMIKLKGFFKLGLAQLFFQIANKISDENISASMIISHTIFLHLRIEQTTDSDFRTTKQLWTDLFLKIDSLVIGF